MPTGYWTYEDEDPVIVLTWPVPMKTGLGQAFTAFQADAGGIIYSTNNGLTWDTSTQCTIAWGWTGLPTPVKIRLPALSDKIVKADNVQFQIFDWVTVPYQAP